MNKYERSYQRLLERLQDQSKETGTVVALLDIDHFACALPDLSYERRIEILSDALTESLGVPILYLGRDEFAVVTKTIHAEETQTAHKKPTQWIGFFSCGFLLQHKALDLSDDLRGDLVQLLIRHQGMPLITV